MTAYYTPKYKSVGDTGKKQPMVIDDVALDNTKSQPDQSENSNG